LLGPSRLLLCWRRRPPTGCRCGYYGLTLSFQGAVQKASSACLSICAAANSWMFPIRSRISLARRWKSARASLTATAWLPMAPSAGVSSGDCHLLHRVAGEERLRASDQRAHCKVAGLADASSDRELLFLHEGCATKEELNTFSVRTVRQSASSPRVVAGFLVFRCPFPPLEKITRTHFS
jgi:hypothetical protein